MVETELFGIDHRGNPVTLFRITNASGEFVELLDYGASIHSICLSNAAGEYRDIVLGVGQADQLHIGSTEGATYGRCANRIADGKFCIDGISYQLTKNWNGHCLHSADDNYAHQMFQGRIGIDEVTFHLVDNGDCGYRCAVDVDVTYSWSNSRVLTVHYLLTAHGDTLLSPTNHTYFSFGQTDIRELVLQINSSYYAEKSPRGFPEGVIRPVSGTCFDFLKPTPIGTAMQKCQSNKPDDLFQYDDNLLLDGSGFRTVASMASPASGLGVTIATDMPAAILYTPYFQKARNGKNGSTYRGYQSVCFETQYVSNAINCTTFAKPVFRSGEQLSSTTSYTFYQIPQAAQFISANGV